MGISCCAGRSSDSRVVCGQPSPLREQPLCTQARSAVTLTSLLAVCETTVLRISSIVPSGKLSRLHKSKPCDPHTAPFFFFLSFLPFFRSRFFNPLIPVLQASAYRIKNASRSSGCTTVLRLILGMSSRSVPSIFVLLLFCTRTKTGTGFSGCVSHSGSSATLVGVGGEDVASKVWRFCVR
jgi:hypothetical protein